jgi:hypothetical protein
MNDYRLDDLVSILSGDRDYSLRYYVHTGRLVHTSGTNSPLPCLLYAFMTWYLCIGTVLPVLRVNSSPGLEMKS